MNREEMLALAERCEQATGPDRELDAQLHEAVTSFPARLGGVGWPEGMLVVPAFPGWSELPRYTASLDAAMSLKPASMAHNFEARDYHRERRVGSWARMTLIAANGYSVGDEGHGASLALATCAAILRATSLIDDVPASPEQVKGEGR